MTFVSLLVFAIGLVLAAALAYLWGRNAGRHTAESVHTAVRLEAERKLGDERTALAQSEERVRGLEKQRDSSTQELRSAQLETERLRTENGELDRKHTRLQSELAAERSAGAERLALTRKAEEERKEFLASARGDMSNAFERLAAQILEDKSKRFTDSNRASIDQLLQPLNQKLVDFQQKVDGLQRDGIAGRTELKTQIEQLRGMNEKLSVDANNLVKALKGSSKQQGDWGEQILVDMLRLAGLEEGLQYRVQASFTDEEGRRARPDIILNLPEGKHLVIDSKVSLTNYAEHHASEEESGRKLHLERHAQSLRTHIGGLTRKKYQDLHGLQSLDFVVMFVPIEPAYLLALSHDRELWQHAWERDVLLVSPGTLFPVIRTIAHIWQQERQTKNVEEILDVASGLYDKVAIFADNFEEVGKKIDSAKVTFDKAFGQLKNGKGHVLSRLTKLRSLGLKTTRNLPESFQADE